MSSYLVWGFSGGEIKTYHYVKIGISHASDIVDVMKNIKSSLPSIGGLMSSRKRFRATDYINLAKNIIDSHPNDLPLDVKFDFYLKEY